MAGSEQQLENQLFQLEMCWYSGRSDELHAVFRLISNQHGSLCFYTQFLSQPEWLRSKQHLKLFEFEQFLNQKSQSTTQDVLCLFQRLFVFF